MPRGRKKKPTKIKELQGTLKAERVVENEMTATLVTEIPNPPSWLTEIGKEEYIKVCNELYQNQMLHKIDMRLIEAYCNAMALQVYRDENGNVKHTQSTPYQTIADKALDKALKIATQFGLTPSARSSISQPTLIQQNNEYNFFE